MPSKDLDVTCANGECTWRWDANAYRVDQLTMRIRHKDGESELREVANDGELVLPDDLEVVEIVSTGEGGERRKKQWRGPGD